MGCGPKRFFLLRMAATSLLAMLPVFGSSAKQASIAAVHYYSTARSTTITVEMDSPVRPITQHLENPPRVVIDLLDTHIHLPGKGTRTFSVSDGLVRQIRVAQNTLRNARVVLDLEHDAVVTITPHKKPQRLNIEVRFKAGRSADDAAAEPAPSTERVTTPPALSARPPVATVTRPAVTPASKPAAKPESPGEPAAPAPVQREEPSNAQPATSSRESPTKESQTKEPSEILGGPRQKIEKRGIRICLGLQVDYPFDLVVVGDQDLAVAVQQVGLGAVHLKIFAEVL